MLKLLKHEFLGAYRSLLKMYIAAFLAAIVAGFAIRSQLDTPFYKEPNFLISLLIFVSIIFLMGTTIGVLIWAIRNFYSSMYKKQGYLTLTLPYSTTTILGSKVIATTLMFVFTTIIMLILLFAMLQIGLSGQVNFIYEFYEGLSFLRLDMWSTLMIILNSIFSTVLQVTVIFAIATFVQTRWTRKRRFLSGLLFFVSLSYISALVQRYVTLPLLQGTTQSFADTISSVLGYAYYSTANELEGIRVAWMYLGDVSLVTMGVNVAQALVLFALSVYLINSRIEID